MDDKIALWVSVKDQLDALKKQEAELRSEILAESFNGLDHIGSLKTLKGNFIIEGSFGVSRKIDQDIELEFLSEEARSAIRIKFDLDKRAYDSLDESATAEIDQYLTVSPTLPTLKVKVNV